ncbi:STE3-domain-containing protein [Peniophora sp. CONT]|nr:STE3-domain-containing protein [Peniophora sp. CONT]
MGAADPSYPLHPIACILAATMLILVLLTSFIRQNWNLCVTFLCFWLFLENLTGAANTIIWSDNADIKHFVYCDIVSHLDMITYVVKPMATLIITRRLYLIASLQSVELPSKAARRRNLVAEWTLGLFVPLIVAGPIYYANQGVRFDVEETLGCTNDEATSILELLTVESWTLIPPLVSIFFYYPKVIVMFYRQNRDMHSFLNSNTSVSRTNYVRILALASVDILLTLPIGVANIVLKATSFLEQNQKLPFYWGWTFLHTHWEPVSYSYTETKGSGTAALAQIYFTQWTSPVLAFTIFGLFGITSEARASYWSIICTVGGLFGWKPTPRARNKRSSLGEIEFGARPQDMSLGDVEMGPGSRRPSFVTPEAPHGSRNAEHTSDDDLVHKSASSSVKETCRPGIEDAPHKSEGREHVAGSSVGTGAVIDV